MINSTKSQFICLFFCLFFLGCGSVHSQYIYDDSYKENSPVKSEKCYDAAVLLNIDMEKTKYICRRFLMEKGITITADTDISIEASQKNGHIAIQYEKVTKDLTFVTVGTEKQDFWGGFLDSCEIVDAIIEKANGLE